MLQHIVPQHYLRGFCDPQPSKRQGQVLWEFRFKEDVVQQHSPKNVGRIRDYYSIPKEGDVPDPVIEGELSKLESGSAPVIAKLRAGTIALSDEERAWLTTFIAFQMVRGPAFRDHVEATMGTAAMLMMKAMGRRPEYLARLLSEAPGIADEDRTPEKAEELAKMAASAEEHFIVTGTPQSSLAMMSVAADLVPALRAMRWEFLIAGGREHFVTSDTPVTVRNPKAPPSSGAGLAMPGTELTMPISPRLCLRATVDPRLDLNHVVTANDDSVRDLNVERTRQAQLFIAGNNQATVAWTRRRYKDLLARGEAHARPNKMYFIDATGEGEVVIPVDVEAYRRSADAKTGT